MINWVDTLSWVFLITGGAFCIIVAVVLLRMPVAYSRFHAASVVDTLGAGFLLLGLMLQAGWTLVFMKLIFMVLLLIFGSPSSTHALARAANVRGLKPLLGKDASHG